MPLPKSYKVTVEIQFRAEYLAGMSQEQTTADIEGFVEAKIVAPIRESMENFFRWRTDFEEIGIPEHN